MRLGLGEREVLDGHVHTHLGGRHGDHHLVLVTLTR